MTPFPKPSTDLPEFVQRAMIQWSDDPICDIDYYETIDEMLKPHHAALLAYEAACNQWWDARREREFMDFAGEWALLDNLALAKKIYELKQSHDNLWDQLRQLTDSYMAHNHGLSAEKRGNWGRERGGYYD